MPEPGRSGVMLAPRLDVMHLEAIALEIRDRHAEVIELAAWKDVAQRSPWLRAAFAATALVVARSATRDRMVQVKPARPAAADGWSGNRSGSWRCRLARTCRSTRSCRRFRRGANSRGTRSSPGPRDRGVRLLFGVVVLLPRQRHAVGAHAVVRGGVADSAPQPQPMSSNVSPGFSAACGRSCRACRAARSRDRCSSR